MTVPVELVTWGLLGGILAVDLAQFAVTLEHRGRLARLEANAGQPRSAD